MNELENNVNVPADVSRDNESEGDDNIENLLSEYYKYLERAHKQQRAYENYKSKNEIAFVPQQKQVKAKASVKSGAYSSNYDHPKYYRYPYSQHRSFSLFWPSNQNGNYVPNLQRISKSDVSAYHDYGMQNKKSPSNEFKPIYDWIQSQCYCKMNKVPCECDCKQCLNPIQYVPGMGLSNEKTNTVISSKLYGKSNKDETANVFKDAINLKIKVTLSLQNLSQILYNRNSTKQLQDESSESGKISIPLTYLDFPMPLNMFANQKNMDSGASHKITVHKKKKTRFNNNKKHKKKMITVHKILIQPHQLFDDHKIENENVTEKKIESTQNITEKNYFIADKMPNNTKIHTDESISLLINITNNEDENATEVTHAIPNSIETENTVKITNINNSTPKPSTTRLKRSLLLSNSTTADLILSNNQTINEMKVVKENNNATSIKLDKKIFKHKKADKWAFVDEELLHWPDNQKKSTENNTRDLTAIILEREKNKTRISISKDTIRRNHTKALEQAIFGEVDWNDIDIVAPAFLSFVGKYLSGALTFCSTKICHSMKCGNKICFHRICKPEERLNNKGHCVGSNSTGTSMCYF
ncbi:uncharacterized protein LOC114245410 [Bombyx mandarina]|uniref:Uncharacterized protein LOC114245410 n=1 Tax=Bombyx mandarina TaxID=7092 RepID=A0A6J2JUU0_BOMMA|nr:uncharacterized protein LOC114245410 [Bombyx mandarina]